MSKKSDKLVEEEDLRKLSRFMLGQIASGYGVITMKEWATLSTDKIVRAVLEARESKNITRGQVDWFRGCGKERA